MSGAKTDRAFSIATLAAMVLLCTGTAQMHAQIQQTGPADGTSTTSSSADATAYSTATNPAGTNGNTASPAGVSVGASSWTAGKGSFGITAMRPAGTSSGANGENWGTGTGSFGMKSQPGGIWHESGSGSMGTPTSASTQSSAAKNAIPETLPGPSVQGPATASSPGRARSGGILALRSQTGTHPTSGGRFGVSNGFRSGGNGSAGSRKASLGASHRTGTQNHAGTSQRSGAGSSSSHAKTNAHSAFTPPDSSVTGGKHQPGTGREPIP